MIKILCLFALLVLFTSATRENSKNAKMDQREAEKPGFAAQEMKAMGRITRKLVKNPKKDERGAAKEDHGSAEGKMEGLTWDYYWGGKKR